MADLVEVHRVTWARWENGLASRRHGEPLGVNPFRHPVILGRIRAELASQEAAKADGEASRSPCVSVPDTGPGAPGANGQEHVRVGGP